MCDHLPEIGPKLVTVYFTPSAELLVAAFGATPCESPNPSALLWLLVMLGRRKHIFRGILATVDQADGNRSL